MQKPTTQRVNEIKHQSPLIVNITNSVSQDIIANGLLSIGAAPIMTNSINEIDELLELANAVVINIGTLDTKFITLAKRACKSACDLNRPIVIDPVGSGATIIRTQTAKDLIEIIKEKSSPQNSQIGHASEGNFSNHCIIRGNLSEISSLVDSQARSKGVETGMSKLNNKTELIKLSKDTNITLAISGKEDYVIAQDLFEVIQGGDEIITKVTGMGCLLSSILACFLVVTKDPFLASKLAFEYYNEIGEKSHGVGPASFRTKFIDNLYNS